MYLCKSVSLLWDKSAALKAIPPTHDPFSTVMSLLGDQHVATEELSVEICDGINSSFSGLSKQAAGVVWSSVS